MLDNIRKESEQKMIKSVESLKTNLAKIRTGRAHPSILDGIKVDYYGNETPLSQVSSIKVEDARTLSVTPWENSIIPDVEKAILRSDLGLNPTTAGTLIRIPLPPLTEETRKHYGKQAKSEAENSRISIRNIRRDILSMTKDLVRAKDLSEDDERRIGDLIQQITDRFVAQIDEVLKAKEKELMEV